MSDDLQAALRAERYKGDAMMLAAELLLENEKLRDLVARAKPIVEADAMMVADLTRHAPFPPKEQAAHDSRVYPSEQWLDDYKKLFLLVFLLFCSTAQAASYRTSNFLVTAHTAEFAKLAGDASEAYRAFLADVWLGKELPDWDSPCPIRVLIEAEASGETRFSFVGGKANCLIMEVRGSEMRILDSVLPHEITHTILATHFGRPVPRWADEGAAINVEHLSERGKQQQLLYNVLTTDRGLPFSNMFVMREYPLDMSPLYSQGYSLAAFLIAQGGHRKFVEYVDRGTRTSWTQAGREFYQYNSLAELQQAWLDWVRQEYEGR